MMAAVQHLGYLGLSQPPSCPSPGVVPGVCYPARFPPTRTAPFDAWRRSLPADVRAAMARQFKPTGKPGDVDRAHTAYAQAAWRALQEALGTTAKAATAVARLQTFDPREFVAVDGFVRELAQAVGDWQVRWDARHAPKEALRAYLRALPADQPVGADGALEAERQAIGYYGLAMEIATGAEQRAATLTSVLQARVSTILQADLGPVRDGLRAVAQAAGAFVREAIRVVVQDIVAPVIGALVPWWLWPVVAYVGYRLLIASPTGQILRRVA